jgi:hypothetical protein
LKCGAGEGWSSVGLIVRKIKKYYVESRWKGVSYLHQEEVSLIGFVILCGNCLLNALLMDR